MALSRLAVLLLALAACATPQKKKSATASPTPLPKGSVPRLDAARPSPMDPEIPDPMAIGSYSVNRQISMYYRLDLKQNNAHAKDIATIMHIYDAPVRACYVERLDVQPKLKGEVELNFALSKESGGMEKIKHVGGSLKDPVLVKCLKRRLAEIPFQPPRDLRGNLRYFFDSTTSSAAKLVPLRTASER